MGLLCDYFLAADDEEAAEVIDWPDGPGKPPSKGLFRKSEVEPYSTLDFKGLEPTVMMGTLEELLTGRPFDELLSENVSPEVASRDDGERVVIRLSSGLQDALTLATDDELREIAGPWSETEEFVGQGDPAYLGELLVQLASMVRHGIATGRRVYCWVCV